MQGTFRSDFYPTPDHLIKRMLEGVKLSEVGWILEPSAGQGHIVDYIAEKIKWTSNRHHVDCIEIDPTMQATLVGKGYNLIHDDFLTFETYKRYGLIIANFPFDRGDQHMMKAIRLLEHSGGRLIALINAETLRNTYTTGRANLKAMLSFYDAQVEYLADQFKDAERRTDVEVALVRMEIPRKDKDDAALTATINKLSGYSHVFYEQYRPQASITSANPMEAMVARYDHEARVGVALIREYEALKPQMQNSFGEYARPILELTVKDSKHTSWAYGDTLNQYLESLRHKYWSALIREPRFIHQFPSNVQEKLETQLELLTRKDFTAFNIRQLERSLMSTVRDGIEKAIMDLFESMTTRYAYHDQYGKNVHYYNGWKSNKAHKINSKVVLPVNGIDASLWSGELRIHHHAMKQITDMMQVFRYLSGEAADVNEIANAAMNLAKVSQSFRNIDLGYFTVTFYKKGTCHIQFTDQKLLDRLNIYAAQKRNWLPPSYGKVRYEDMDSEEQAVVDEFQGEEAYSDVMSDAAFYLSDPVMPLSTLMLP